jgi:DNA-binding GntR family transcriptional regulator
MPTVVARAIERSVLADQVKDRILEGIVTGHYPPDSRIVETQVARELGTSQAPVREALRGLEAIGVVEITPFRGARVRRPSRREILEAYEVRSALESLAATRAVPVMADVDVASLSADLEAMRAAAAADDGRALAEADARFHGRIVALSDSGILGRLWRSLEPSSRTYLTLVVPGADPRWSAELHAPIVEALAARDSEGVAAALRRHFVEIGDDMNRRWREPELVVSDPDRARHAGVVIDADSLPSTTVPAGASAGASA